jgi:hypothetical protein
MLIIFEDIKNNITEIHFTKDDFFNVENITNYQYNIYKEIIPTEEIEYLLKIKSKNINLNKFFIYKKNDIFNMYIISRINYLPINLKKNMLLKNFDNKKEFKNEFIRNLIKIYEVSFEDISLSIVNKIPYFSLNFKLILKEHSI